VVITQKALSRQPINRDIFHGLTPTSSVQNYSLTESTSASVYYLRRFFKTPQ